MKSKLLYYILIIAFFFSILGCSKDDNPEFRNNAFVVDETEYTLTQGTIENYGFYYEGESYNFDIRMFSAGLTYNADYTFSGFGHMVYFEIFAEPGEDIKSGIYTYNANSASPGYFDMGVFAIGFDAETEETSAYFEVSGGTVKIGRSGDNYEIVMNCIASGKEMSGYYKGQLANYDYRKKTVGIRFPDKCKTEQ